LGGQDKVRKGLGSYRSEVKQGGPTGRGKDRRFAQRATRVVVLGETLAGSFVATGDEAETRAMVAVATKACTTKLRERRCSAVGTEAGRGEVKRNSISNQAGVDPERFIRQHASRRIHRDQDKRSVVARLDWAELCPTRVRRCCAPSENHARIA
jgi:hypothetical protein